MDNITRRDAELPYISDDAVFDQQKVTRRLLREFNTTDPSDFETLGRLAGKIVNGGGKMSLLCRRFTVIMDSISRWAKDFLQITTVPYWMWQR